MKKVLIVITSDLYVRNYLRSGAFSELSRRFECHYLADARVNNRDDLDSLGNFLGYFSLSPKMRNLHELHFNIMMWRYRKRSPTFTYRWLRNSSWHTVVQTGNILSRLLRTIRWCFGTMRNPLGFRIPLLGNPVVFPVAAAVIRSQLAINKGLSRRISAQEYDAIIFPSSAFDAATVDLIRIGKNLKIPTLCLIDNWDNLTSKTVFWERPDYLGVWGNQAKEQAMKIHDFRSDQVVLLGTPRFEKYFAMRESAIRRHYRSPYILFVGSAMPFDELGVLHLLERIITKTQTGSGPELIIYRPHPWQQKRVVNAVFNHNDFSIVKLDTQIATAYESGLSPESTDEKFQPDLDYYPSLLRNADAVVGPLTTMLLEAALMLRPVVGLNYFDGFHSNTSLQYFSHFEGTERIPGFSLCESADALPQVLRRALSLGTISAKESDAVTQHFVYRDSRTYPERLSDLVASITRLDDAGKT